MYLQETWNLKNDTILLDGYTVYCNNRTCINKKSPKGSGGVAIAVKDKMFEEYIVDMLECEVDGVLIMRLTNKHTDYTCALVNVYLPPENSVYGDDPAGMFEHLLANMFELCEMDLIIMGGDFNARLGNMKDYIEDLDEIPPRTVLDENQNEHGKLFNDFLLQSKMCVINGRIDPLEASYTSILQR